MEKLKCDMVGMLDNGGYEKMHDISRRVYSGEGAAPTLHTCGGGNLEPKILTGGGTTRTAAMRGRNPNNPNDRTAGTPTEQRLEIGGEVANTITTVQKDSLVVEPIIYDGFNQRIRADQDTAVALTRNCGADLKRNGQGIIEVIKETDLPVETNQLTIDNEVVRVRKLTERECFRLMGVKDEDFDKIAKNQSKSSLYHLAGDSIVTAVLVAIFKQMI